MSNQAYNPNWTTAEYFAWNGKLASQGMAAKAARGEYPSAAPLGYKNVRTPEGTRLEIDPETAPLVREAFRLHAQGLSIRKILRIVTERGLRSKHGKPLGPSALHHMLSNPVYHGVIMWNGQKANGAHQPIAPRAPSNKDTGKAEVGQSTWDRL
jgi:site-specific DNA recombinase